jgi:serine/threonine protein kinase
LEREGKLPSVSVRAGSRIRFGSFELDTRSGELRQDGRLIRLQEQPLRLLTLLLERRGDVVLREDIRRRLWPNDTAVEIGHGINAAVQRLREALNESAENPCFIETVARRGYRFRGDPQSAASEMEGRTIAHFRVLGKLGSGGMGLVYRAEDLRLGREVALKLLPPELAGDRAAIARFHREARAASALNHPNICTIYGVEEYDGQPVIVMELVAGPTLAAVLERGPLDRAAALSYAAQIAGALDAAHRKGVIHRDLKPANIVVGETGVKVLDFGLAKVERGSAGGDTVTREGAVMGTPDYMSPEQVRGLEVDGRSDIFSMGVVLHEMVTGRRPGAESRGQAIPGALGEVVDRCLYPRQDERWQSARELQTALERIAAAPPVALPPSPWSRRRWMALIGAASGAAVLLGVKGADGLLRPKLRRSVVPSPGGEMTRLSLSPDGRRLAFFAGGRFHIRALGSAETRIVAGVPGPGTPFWSPDGRQLGIASAGKLRVVDLTTGAVTILADVNTNIGGSWGHDGTILIGLLGDGIHRIPATGGTLTRVTSIDESRDESRHLLPQFLPGGQSFLFTAGAKTAGKSVLYAASLDAGKRRPVLPLDSGAAFVPNGRIVYGRRRALMSMRFDADRWTSARGEVVIAEGLVARAAIGSTVELLEFTAAGSTVAYRIAGEEGTRVAENWWAGETSSL